MFDRTENLFAPAKFAFQTSEQFELSIKTRLKWSNKEWAAAGESGTRLNKLCHSLSYWKQKLKAAMDEKSMVFTLYNVEKDVKFDILKIITEIESLDTSIQVKGISEFRNPRYLCIHFENSEEKNRIESRFKMIEDSYVTYVSWALSPEVDVTTLKIHWLPLTMDINVIKKELEKYVNCVEETRVNLTFMSGREMPTGRITFKVKIKKDVKIEEIPHVTTIAKMETLITISGRQPLCLNCNRLGHISKECELRYCTACKKMKSKIHECSVNSAVRSFADVAKEGQENTDANDKENEIIIEDNEQRNEGKIFLSQKIIGLEKQIQSMEKEDQESVKNRLEKKRKMKYPTVTDEQGINQKTLDLSNVELEAFSWAADQDGLSDYDDDIMQQDSSFVKALTDQASLEDDVSENAKGDYKIASQTKKNKKEKDEQGETQKKKDIVLKNYGKPASGSSQRRRQSQKFDKTMEIREFVFKD